MRMPVILALPAQEPLRASASAAINKEKPQIAFEETKVPAGFLLDTSFAAVPLGIVEQGFMALEGLNASNSRDFAVRGSIEVSDEANVPADINGNRVFADPIIAPFPYCSGAAQGTTSNVKQKLNVSGLVSKSLDGTNVAIAIVDTGINLAHLTSKLGAAPRFDAANSWRPAGAATTPGQYPVDHGTMCAYDALIAAPKAVLLDYPVLAGTSPGGNITGRTISTALRAFSDILANYAVAFAPGGIQQYAGLVISNSWGIYHPSWDFPSGHPGRYCDNPKHPFATVVKALVSAGADVLFAAGNCGANCPDSRCQGRSVGAIMGANAYSEVLTVAACLVTNNDRLGYSSQGPSITGMPPNKPDATTYSHFLGSEAFGAGSPDSGTSAACPVLAGCVAAIRTKRSPAILPPASLIAQFQAMAVQNTGIPSGWNADFGHGVVDPLAVATSLGL